MKNKTNPMTIYILMAYKQEDLALFYFSLLVRDIRYPTPRAPKWSNLYDAST